MKIKDANRYGALDPEILARFEKRVGSTLPLQYREFLLKHNGGEPEPAYFEISESQGDSHLHHVLGLHDGPDYLRLDRHYEGYLHRMPASIIPIAGDDAGNAICIGIRGLHIGKVFFWDHEREAEDGESWENVTEIASTFQAFLDGLFQWVDPDETDLERAIKSDDVEGIKKMLSSGMSIEAEDQQGRTMIENAAIHNSTKIIEYLHGQGARLRNALALANQNARFFADHRRSVALLESFGNQR